MSRQAPKRRPEVRFVPHLPDLITEEDYLEPPGRKKVRVRITVDDDGVKVLGDSMYARELEELLARCGGGAIERMLCG